MAKNNHPSTTDIRDKLDIKLFSQHFSSFSGDRIELKDAKVIAQLYARLENTISVLSDLEGRKSYLYLGGVADQIGFEPISTEINSIWEDELLSRVHPDDLQKKYRLEFSFSQLLKSIDLTERTNYSLITKLRIKNQKGKYVSIKHRLLYLSSTSDGNVSLALCLYDIVAPATSPATVAKIMGSLVVLAAATPMARLEIEMMPSFAPNTAALNQLLRWI